MNGALVPGLIRISQTGRPESDIMEYSRMTGTTMEGCCGERYGRRWTEGLTLDTVDNGED